MTFIPYKLLLDLIKPDITFRMEKETNERENGDKYISFYKALCIHGNIVQQKSSLKRYLHEEYLNIVHDLWYIAVYPENEIYCTNNIKFIVEFKNNPEALMFKMGHV